MICANCGGTIHVNSPCEDCKISYEDMINNISHMEMKRLFKKMYTLMQDHQDITLEESLLACELENSSFILPTLLKEDDLGIIQLPNNDGKKYIALCTDIEEFKKFKNDELTPITNSWSNLLKLLNDNCEGFVINVFSEECVLSRKYLDDFFKG